MSSKKTPPSPLCLPDVSVQDGRRAILDLLRALTMGALEQGQYAVALKGLELWGKEEGLFCGRESGKAEIKPLSQMSDEELETLLSDLS